MVDYHHRYAFLRCWLCVTIRALRRRHGVVVGAPVNIGRRRRAADPKMSAAARRGPLSSLLSHTYFKSFSAKDLCLKGRYRNGRNE